MTRRPRFVRRSEDVIDEHTEPPAGDRKYVHGPSAGSTDPEVLRREQQDEAAQSWAGFGAITDAQFKGGVVGIAAGTVAGALLFLPLGLIGWGGLAIGWRLAIAALCGALAGTTAMALYLGGRRPELEGETQDADDRPSVGTTPRDPRTDARGR